MNVWVYAGRQRRLTSIHTHLISLADIHHIQRNLTVTVTPIIQLNFTSTSKRYLMDFIWNLKILSIAGYMAKYAIDSIFSLNKYEMRSFLLKKLFEISFFRTEKVKAITYIYFFI